MRNVNQLKSSSTIAYLVGGVATITSLYIGYETGNDVIKAIYAVGVAILIFLITSRISSHINLIKQNDAIHDFVEEKVKKTQEVVNQYAETSENAIDLFEKWFSKSSESSFSIVDNDTASFITTKKIIECNYTRIIGTARQDIVEGAVNNNIHSENVAFNYLEKSKERFCKGKNNFHYRRITIKNLQNYFAGHLKEILNLAEENKHDAKIAFLNTEFPPVSYQIFDTDFLIIIVDNTGGEFKTRDYGIAITCTETKVIQAFKDHFDNYWRHLEKTTSTVSKAEDLEEVLKGGCKPKPDKIPLA